MAKKKAAATNGNHKSIVHLVLDKSGSMSAIHGATIEGVNHFIKETKLADPTALYSEIQFDDDIVRRIQAQPIGEVELLDDKSYRMGGSTALLDAVGTAVSDIEKMESRPEKVVIVIMTDGQENASHEYTRESIKALVSKHEGEDNWQFLFLGADLDAFSEAGALGMGRVQTSSVRSRRDHVGTQVMYASASMANSNYLRGFDSNVTLTQADYDNSLAEADNAAQTTPTTTK